MNETFIDKLSRVGYMVHTDDSRFIVKPTNGKIITGIVLIIIGFLLTPFYKVPFGIIRDLIDDSYTNSTNLFTFCIATSATVISILAIYKGLHRLFDFIGFNVSVNDNKLNYSLRKDISLVKKKQIEIDKFIFTSENNTSTISYLDKSGTQHTLINEVEAIIDTKSTLNELTKRLNMQLK